LCLLVHPDWRHMALSLNIILAAKSLYSSSERTSLQNE
jgi:hypothetical protein